MLLCCYQNISGTISLNATKLCTANAYIMLNNLNLKKLMYSSLSASRITMFFQIVIKKVDFMFET